MIQIEKWPGLVTNASPYAIPPGAAAEQKNLICINPGQIFVRNGLTQKTLASSDTSSAVIRKAFRYQMGTAENLLYQDENGHVYASAVNIYIDNLVTENGDNICTHDSSPIIT